MIQDLRIGVKSYDIPSLIFCYFSLAFCLQIDGNCKEKFSLATDENETIKLWQLSLR